MPFCDEEQYSVCVIDKETLGLYYGCLDTLMAIMILAGYFWVHSFIRDEFETIKRNTVTAAGEWGVSLFELGKYWWRYFLRSVCYFRDTT